MAPITRPPASIALQMRAFRHADGATAGIPNGESDHQKRQEERWMRVGVISFSQIDHLTFLRGKPAKSFISLAATAIQKSPRPGIFAIDRIITQRRHRDDTGSASNFDNGNVQGGPAPSSTGIEISAEEKNTCENAFFLRIHPAEHE